MKRPVIKGVILPFFVADAGDDFETIVLPEAAQALSEQAWAKGYVVTSAFEVVTDPAKIAELSSAAIEAFNGTDYAKKKVAAAQERAKADEPDFSKLAELAK